MEFEPTRHAPLDRTHGGKVIDLWSLSSAKKDELKQLKFDPKRVKVADIPASTGTKEALVAEPLSQYEYIIKEPVNSPILGRSAVIIRRY